MWTYSLRFVEQALLVAMFNAYGRSCYEILNHEKMSKVRGNERTRMGLASPLVCLE
jgi:hypothetical protein